MEAVGTTGDEADEWLVARRHLSVESVKAAPVAIPEPKEVMPGLAAASCRYSFDAELFHLLLHVGLSRRYRKRQETHKILGRVRI